MLGLEELEESTGARLDRYLLKEYKIEYVLDLSIREGVGYAIDSRRMEEESRLYTLWVQLATSPYTKTPGYTEFKEELYKSADNKPSVEVKNKKLGTIRGTDLTRG